MRSAVCVFGLKMMQIKTCELNVLEHKHDVFCLSAANVVNASGEFSLF